MVQEIRVETWEDFERELAQVRDYHVSSGQRANQPLLFRGQSNSTWGLDTTLDRANRIGMHFGDYYRIISSFRLEIETFTGANWDIQSAHEVQELVKDYGGFSLRLNFGQNPAYAYMAYLRHHGFPSPLLDWTHSPHIAAYFAFSKAVDSDRVSIYVLSQAKFSSGAAGVPRVHRFGPNVKTDRRHVLQQSEYTMCVVFRPETEWCFAKHDDVLTAIEVIDGTEWGFDLKKFSIPTSERTKVLRSLDEHNLNAFSLFGSEESLMETMALRTLTLRQA